MLWRGGDILPVVNELFLHYDDLAATTTAFSGFHDTLLQQGTVWVPDTGIVDITGALSAIQGNATDLASELTKVGAACTEVAKEVQHVDHEGRLTLAPYIFATAGLDNTGYVHHGTGPYQVVDNPQLIIPGVVPYGPGYPTPPAPEPEPDK